MKLIELHILQSFPVSCLNRDDVGSPKTAIFGGVNRSRISSQCLKRAIREYAQTAFPEAHFNGQRTRLIVNPLKNALEKHGLDANIAEKHALAIADSLAGLDKKSLKEKEGNTPRISTLIFLAPSEIDGLAKEVAAAVKEAKDYSKNLAKICKSIKIVDAADIALFGRMIASHPSLSLEGAAMFSHALSTHRSDNDLDFFVGIDDGQHKQDDTGAAMLGTLEFSSAVYYRYIALNLDLLFSGTHLGGLPSEERKKVVDAFIRSTLMAMPSARKNTMNAHTLPAYVLGLVKDRGQPVQLINAFEKPVFSRDGMMKASIEHLKTHHETLKYTWGLTTQLEVELPEKNLTTFCSEILNHVQ